MLTEWKPKLLGLLQEEKIMNPRANATQVAKQLQSNPSFISMVVNRGFGLNFNDFINQFRIEAVKEMLKKGEHKKQTLLGIAYECGFNSKATFNRAFKKVTGLYSSFQKNGTTKRMITKHTIQKMGAGYMHYISGCKASKTGNVRR